MECWLRLALPLLVVAGCGRYGFEARSLEDGVDGGATDAAFTPDSFAVAGQSILAAGETGIALMSPDIVARADGWSVTYLRREEVATDQYDYTQYLVRLSPTLEPLEPPIELFSYSNGFALSFDSAISSDGSSTLVVFQSYDTNYDLRLALVDEAGVVTQERQILDDVSAGTFDVGTNSQNHLVTWDDASGLRAFPIPLDGSAVGSAGTGAPGGRKHRVVPRPSGFAIIHSSVRDEVRKHPVDDEGNSTGTTAPVGVTVRSSGGFDATAANEQVMVGGVIDDSLSLIRLDAATLSTTSAQNLTLPADASRISVAAAGDRFATLRYSTATGALVELFDPLDEAGLGAVAIDGLAPGTNAIAANSSGQAAVVGLEDSSPAGMAVVLVGPR